MAIKKRLWWIIAGGVAAVLIVGGVVVRGRGNKPMAVQTAKADRQKIVQKVSATGKIQPRTKVDISADVSGKIERLAVVEGQWVEKGAFLVGLARERYVAAVESAVANVSAAQANAALVHENLNRTKNEFERSKELLASGNESKVGIRGEAGRVPWSRSRATSRRRIRSRRPPRRSSRRVTTCRRPPSTRRWRGRSAR